MSGFGSAFGQSSGFGGGDAAASGFGGGGFGGSENKSSGFGGASSGFGEAKQESTGFGGGGSGFGNNSGGFGGGGGSGFGNSGGGSGFGGGSGGGGFGGGSGGGFGGGAGGGERPRGCFNCGQEGHRSADCTEPKKPRGACFNCNQEGHNSRDCPEPRKPREGGGGGGGNRACFNCNQEGHQSRDCPEPRKPREPRAGGGGGFGGGGASSGFGGGATDSGFGGGSSGFGGGASSGFGGGASSGFGGGASSGFGGGNNESSGFGGGGSGFGGGAGGGEKPRGCFNCGQEGHRSADCTEPRKERTSGCFNCQSPDHIGRDCPLPKKPKEGEACFNCGDPGHMSANCPNPRAEGSKPPASTFIPEENAVADLYGDSIEAGALFSRFYDAAVKLSRGGTAGQSVEIKKLDSFVDAGFTETILENVTRAGYRRPTPVQMYTMPLVQQGNDVMACAQTGSGKTAAFLLPAMSQLLKDNDLSNSAEIPCQPRCVVVAPTRELAMQIHSESRKFADRTILYTAAVFGGTAVNHCKESLARGATIIIGTIGRLLHFVNEGIISLAKVKYLVLDEADRMLDMGFGEDINKLMSHPTMSPKAERQTLLFSATFPDEVQTVAREHLKENYVMVTIDEIGVANKCITQEIIKCERNEKKDKLLSLLNVDLENYTTSKDAEIFKKKTLVFVSRKVFADTLGAILCQAGLPCTTIHGDRLQQQRNEAINDFKKGRKPVLIATAVAERGLDIKGVDHVINYDLPTNQDEYVHRIGRTGRVGNAGRATSFYVEENDSQCASYLLNVMSKAEQVVPDWLQGAAGAGGNYGFGGSVPKQSNDDEAW